LSGRLCIVWSMDGDCSAHIGQSEGAFVEWLQFCLGAAFLSLTALSALRLEWNLYVLILWWVLSWVRAWCYCSLTVTDSTSRRAINLVFFIYHGVNVYFWFLSNRFDFAQQNLVFTANFTMQKFGFAVLFLAFGTLLILQEIRSFQRAKKGKRS